MEEDWQVICEHSLFANRLNQLELICEQDFRGVNCEFIENYLRPVVELLDTIRSRCEDYYGLRSKKQTTSNWTSNFENIVRYAIHPKVLDVTLEKGEFYIHISTHPPRGLVLKYFYNGKLASKELSMTDSILMCSENWLELLKSELRDRSLFSICIVWLDGGFEKITWPKLLNREVKSNEQNNQELIEKDVSLNKSITPLNVQPSTEDSTMKALSVLDLNFELLHNQVAFLPGSQDKRGGPVIFIDSSKDCWENTNFNSDDLTRLLFYYYAIPRESSREKGFSLVIDARGGLHTKDILECIGESILAFQTQMPSSVHMAYVLTKKDSLMLLFTASKVKEKLNFEFQFVSSLDKLHRDISIDQIPLSMGGTLKYDHEQWIKFRTKIEPFMTCCRSAAKHAMEYLQDLNNTNVGYSYDESRQILDQYKEKVAFVLEDTRLLGLKHEGKELIDRLSSEESALPRTDDFHHTLECLKKLYTQMLRVFDRLQAIANSRTENLEVCTKMRKFEEDSVKIMLWFKEEGIPFLDKHKEIADSLGHADSLVEEFDKFTEKSKEIVEMYEETLSIGNYLNDLKDLDFDHNLLGEHLKELTQLRDAYTQKYQERKKKLTQCVDFHTFVKETTKWWMSGMQHIAHINMEDIQTLDGIERLKTSIEEFLTNNPPMRESKIARITELAHHLGSKQVEQAEQVKSQCLEVQQMFKIKQNQINGAEERYKKLHRDSLIYSEGDENSSGFKDDLSSETSDGDYMNQTNDDVINDYTNESISSMDNQYGVNLFSWKDNNQPYDENDAKLAVYDAAMPSKMKERLRHIIDEMITTEHEYVNSLEYILLHYLPMMDQDELPPTLKGKKNVLFGNIKRIYDFHHKFFSQEIETFRHAPLQIGKCFLKWERQFYLYALYNKNKPRSDQLWDDFGNAYFQAKMKELKDKLDLASYLIKPVQRLGKYALLLKDMMSCCDQSDPRVIEIQSAHELMKFQLRHGNDLLAMDSIRDSDINLKDQGCLLRQADFLVWYGKRKRVRRVFLFEHVIVFCKAKKQKAKHDIFLYKHSIKTVDVGLTESIGDSGLKFEIWYRRWRKGRAAEAFILQGASEEVKLSWTQDITRILWRQASRNKEYGITEAATGISVESTPSSILFESNSNNNFSRSRTVDIPSSREMTPNNKRLSWLSAADSSGSSGVFDLGSLPEDAHSLHSMSRDDSRLFYQKNDEIKYSSLPRKKLTHSNTQGEITVSRKNSQNSFDGSFIRNNVYRKTFQPESININKNPPKKPLIRRNKSSGGRFATQPITLPSEAFQKVSDTQPGSTASLTRTRSKKVSSDGPVHSSIDESSQENLLSCENTSECVASTPEKNTVVLRRHSNTGVNRRDPRLRHSRSFNDCSIDFESSSSEVISNNRAYIDTPPIQQKSLLTIQNEDTAKTKRYSFTKSLTVIDIDSLGSRKETLNRERSLSSTDTSVFAVDQQKNKPGNSSNNKKTASTASIAKQIKSANETRKKPFQNLKKKISKSLSEI